MQLPHVTLQGSSPLLAGPVAMPPPPPAGNQLLPLPPLARLCVRVLRPTSIGAAAAHAAAPAPAPALELLAPALKALELAADSCCARRAARLRHARWMRLTAPSMTCSSCGRVCACARARARACVCEATAAWCVACSRRACLHGQEHASKRTHARARHAAAIPAAAQPTCSQVRAKSNSSSVCLLSSDSHSLSSSGSATGLPSAVKASSWRTRWPVDARSASDLRTATLRSGRAQSGVAVRKKGQGAWLCGLCARVHARTHDNAHELTSCALHDMHRRRHKQPMPSH